MRPFNADTIAAIATAPGTGAVAIVRVSGPRAVEVADAVFRGSAPLAEAGSHTVHFGRAVTAEGQVVDEVLATLMRAPRSYTTEDVVEFGCHGGSVAARGVLDACLEAGARPARRGEFTERAFLGGRLDLVQAEAVADIVGARTRTGLAAALGQLDGRLSQELAAAREELISYRADVESLVDFEAEDVEPPDLAAVAARGESALAALERLLEGARLGEAVRDGLSVAIVGRPNVGKSSLMNALLGRDRAIVTEAPGTTRDVIEEVVDLEGVPVRLVDTAGWRETTEPAEAAGVSRSRAAAAGADVVLLVFDLSEGWTSEDTHIAESIERGRAFVVGNKKDLVPGGGPSALPEDVMCVSAVRGDGLAALGAQVVLRGAGSAESMSVTNVRHADALRRARRFLAASVELLTEGQSIELAAQEAAGATEALGEITGETTPEDVLRNIFERFCVGK